jgi:hypothetical protein
MEDLEPEPSAFAFFDPYAEDFLAAGNTDAEHG